MSSAFRIQARPHFLVSINVTAARNFTHFAHNRKALSFFPTNILRTKDDQVDGHGNRKGKSNTLRMLMFGKPGVGKGTLSARLVGKYDILTLSTGDLLRQHIAEKSEVGRQAEDIVAHGGLLPDELMLKVVTSKLDLVNNKHWILDGFPRTLGQGELLDTHLKKQGIPLSLIVNLDVPDEVILSRISDRWVHLPSGRVYNMTYNRPRVDGYDDETGEPLTKRPDDNPEIFSRRLTQFYKSTSPLLTFFAAHPSTKLVTLTGATSDEIWPKLDGAVRELFPNLKERSKMPSGRRQHNLNDAVMAGGVGKLQGDVGRRE
jgi:nucleoside-triphosphate--adenylate kinase